MLKWFTPRYSIIWKAFQFIINRLPDFWKKIFDIPKIPIIISFSYFLKNFPQPILLHAFFL